MGRLLLLIASLATIASPALAQQAPIVVVVEPSPPVTSAPVVTGAIMLSPPVASAPVTWGAQVPPESFAPQPEREPATRSMTNWPLVASGIAALAGGWALGWLTTFVWNLASSTCHPSGYLGLGLSCTVAGPYGEGDWQMAIPLVGPWLTFTTNTFRGSDIAFPVFIGILEPVGLILMIIGLTSPIERRPRSASIEVTPGLGSLSIHGTF